MHLPASPASTEFLIGHTMDDLLLSLMEAGPALHQNREACLAQHSDLPFYTAFMFIKFSEMLAWGLSSTSAKMTGKIRADIQIQGCRTEVIVSKRDATVARANQNTDCIQDLQDQLEATLSKINDLENRSRRYSFRIRWFPRNCHRYPCCSWFSHPGAYPRHSAVQNRIILGTQSPRTT